MAGAVRHIRRHLRHSEAVAALLDELERRERLLAVIRDTVPAALAAHCRQAGLEAGRLTLLVDSPVWVDRLRFLSPQFVDAITASGVKVVECRVRAAPGLTTGAGPTPVGTRLPRSPVAARCLEQAAASLGDGALARSLARLAHSCGHAPAAPGGPKNQPTASGCE
jgi:hypothetical protein